MRNKQDYEINSLILGVWFDKWLVTLLSKNKWSTLLTGKYLFREYLSVSLVYKFISKRWQSSSLNVK